jgi:hypothetical protein
MRRIILLALIVLASSSIITAQSAIGYVNTEKILEKIPDYVVAQ